VVVQHGVCPFAAPSLAAPGQVERRVLASLDEARAAIDALAADARLAVGLLIFPLLTLDAVAFDRGCMPLRAAHPAFVAAVFHPETPYATATAAQAVGFFRRAPDPTLQLVRAQALDDVRGGKDVAGKFLFDYSAAAWQELERRQGRVPLSERIARDNHRLLGGKIAALQAIYDDIRADRERSYARASGG
jgi:hypothetical protein